MERTITVIFTNEAPEPEELKRQNAAVVRGTWEMAEFLYLQSLVDTLRVLGISRVYSSRQTYQHGVAEIYYRLVTKSPVFSRDLPELSKLPPALQLALEF